MFQKSYNLFCLKKVRFFEILIVYLKIKKNIYYLFFQKKKKFFENMADFLNTE